MIDKHHTVCTLNVNRLTNTFVEICDDLAFNPKKISVHVTDISNRGINNVIIIKIDKWLMVDDPYVRKIIKRLREIEDFENTQYASDENQTCTLFVIITKYHFDNHDILPKDLHRDLCDQNRDDYGTSMIFGSGNY